jgi:hypothetical protein
MYKYEKHVLDIMQLLQLSIILSTILVVYVLYIAKDQMSWAYKRQSKSCLNLSVFKCDILNEENPKTTET